MIMQVQIQALLARGAVARGAGGGAATEMAKPQIFDGTLSKVTEFISACKLYQDEVEEGVGRRTNSVDFIICAGRSSRCMEEEHSRRFGSRRS